MADASLGGAGEDPRRLIPRTDELLGLPAVARARGRLAEGEIRRQIAAAQNRARRLEIPPEDVASEAEELLGRARSHGLSPVINATGVVVHTNLGRAPLSTAAVDALSEAAGPVDVELDLSSGRRSSRRGATAREALLDACGAGEAALVVNNGASALLLAVTALAGGGAAVISRGELIEIGAGFRIPELLQTTGTTLIEVGATNRTHPRDYERALDEWPGPGPIAILKVHTSNYRVEGFTAEATTKELAGIARDRGVPLVADIGSGLLTRDEALPGEPDARGALKAGADVVVASGDKLLGGPQAGIAIGTSEAIGKMGRHPLSRAVRIDKLRLAALEATLRGPVPPVTAALHASPDELRRRCEGLARATGAGRVVPHEGRVGGGGAPGVPLPGFAVAYPRKIATLLREPGAGERPVLGRLHDDALLIDPRCVPEGDDDLLAGAIARALERLDGGDGAGEAPAES